MGACRPGRSGRYEPNDISYRTPRASGRRHRPSVGTVISDRHVGSEVVTTLDRSTNVCLVTDHDGVAGQTPDDTRVVVGDGRERAVLRDAGAQTTDIALISMQADHPPFRTQLGSVLHPQRLRKTRSRDNRTLRRFRSGTREVCSSDRPGRDVQRHFRRLKSRNHA